MPCERLSAETMNQPTAPAITATIVPASSALTMNGYSVSCCMSEIRSGDGPAPARALAAGMAVAVLGGGLGQADHYEAAICGAEDFDRGAV